MAKRKLDFKDLSSVEAFVHDVTPVKTAKRMEGQRPTYYFHMTLQTGQGEFHRGVSFQSDDQESMAKISVEKSPVKLVGVEKAMSRHKPGDYDIKLTKHSRVLMMKERDVKFMWTKAPVDAVEEVSSTLKNIHDGKVPLGKVVVVDVKVIGLDEPTERFSSGKKVNLTKAWVGDESHGRMELAVWDNKHGLEVGSCYNLKATVKSFRQQFHLSLLNNSEKRIEDVPCAEDSSDTHKGELTFCNVSVKYRCPMCFHQFEDIGSVILTCESCRAKMKKKALRKSLDAVVSFDSEKMFSIKEKVLEKALNEKELKEKNEIEEFFLSQDEITLKCVEDDVVLIAF